MLEDKDEPTLKWYSVTRWLHCARAGTIVTIVYVGDYLWFVGIPRLNASVPALRHDKLHKFKHKS